MKIALIGLGDIAQKAYLPLLHHWPQVEWLFCSRNPQVLASLAAQYRIDDIYTDYQQLPELDAVMIHSATASHLELAAYFLARRVAVFVDKPLCDNYADCERLYALAARFNVPLFVGFNRRYLPLLRQQAGAALANSKDIRSMRWEKHRHNQPGDIRTFVFDDFIHALDGVNLSGRVNPADMQIYSQMDGQQLARLDCHWHADGGMYHASMDRCYGMTCERIQLSQLNQTLELDGFLRGTRWSENRAEQLALADWTPMLHSKGFYAMLVHWLEVVKSGRLADEVIARNLNSHRLCEEICQRLTRAC